MRGFSILELLLALMILTSTLAAVELVTLDGPASLADGVAAREAAEIVARAIDEQFVLATTAFASIVSDASTTAGIYTSSLSVTTLPDGMTKRLISSVSWNDSRERRQFLSLQALLPDFVDVSTHSPCSDVIGGNWTRPQELTFMLSPGSLLPLGTSAVAHPISTFIAASSTLIAGVGTSLEKSDATLFILDISSSTNPSYLGSVDNSSSTKEGVNALALSGTSLFAANAAEPNFATCKASSACSQLQIFDITDPAAPALVENYQLPTTTAPYAVGSGGQSIGKSIAYANGLIYLGLSKTGSSLGEEFNILNVQNVHSPRWLGGFQVGRSVNRILVQGAYAYLATDDPVRELIVLNVQDPTTITEIGTYDAPGAPEFGYARDLALASTTLLLGRTYSPNAAEFSILSLASSTPGIAHITPLAGLLSTVDVNAVLIRNYLAYVLTSSALQLLDISDTGNPLPVATIALPNESTGTALSCVGNTVYVGSTGADSTGYVSAITGS